jgi:hypothetical protein
MNSRLLPALVFLATLLLCVLAPAAEPIRAVAFRAAEVLWTLGLVALEAPVIAAAAGLVLIGGGAAVVRRRPDWEDKLAAAVAIPVLLAPTFVLVQATSLHPGLFVAAAAGLIAGAAGAGRTLPEQLAPTAASWRSLALLGIGGVVVLATTHTFGDGLLDAGAAAAGSGSRLFGRAWGPAWALGAVAAAVLARTSPDAVVVAVAAGIAATAAEGRGLEGGAAIAGPGFVVAAAAAGKLLGERGFDPLALKTMHPRRLLGALVPWTAAAALVTAHGFLFGAWDCGKVDRDTRVTVLAQDIGGFAAVPMGDYVVASRRRAGELVVVGREGGVWRTPVTDWFPDRPDADQLRPEALLPVGDGLVLVLANSPSPGVDAGAAIVDVASRQAVAAVPELECTEATDAVLSADAAVVYLACPGWTGAGGTHVGSIERRRVSDLTLVDRTMLPGYGIDRLVATPSGRQILGANPGRTALAWLEIDPDGSLGAGVRGQTINDIVLDIAVAGDGVVRATRYLRGDVVELGADRLMPTGATRIGWGARALLCDEAGCAAASSITGRLERLDGTSSIPLGGHVRRLVPDADGRFGLAASDCGIVRFER